ncbi:MAG: TMEM165/GDT1 family protein [Stenomitos frigidus ULC029]
MEVPSSAVDITPLLKTTHLVKPFGKAYRLTEPVLSESEPLPKPEGASQHPLIDSTIAPTVASSATAASLAIAKGSTSSQWKVFGTTFITIFLAELGDKTQVATLLMSAESHAPWIVFTGAAGALVTTSLLGVLVGQWLSSRVSPKTLDTAAGIMMAFLSLWLFLDVMRM